jgi:hypothetical protein
VSAAEKRPLWIGLAACGCLRTWSTHHPSKLTLGPEAYRAAPPVRWLLIIGETPRRTPHPFVQHEVLVVDERGRTSAVALLTGQQIDWRPEVCPRQPHDPPPTYRVLDTWEPPHA